MCWSRQQQNWGIIPNNCWDTVTKLDFVLSCLYFISELSHFVSLWISSKRKKNCGMPKNNKHFANIQCDYPSIKSIVTQSKWRILNADFNHIVIFQVHFSQQTKNSLLNRIVIWPNWKCRIRFNFYLMELHKRDDWLHIFVMCWRDLVRGFSVSKCLFFRPIEIWSMNFYSNSMSLVSMPSMANVTLFLLILPLCVRACKCVCVSKLRSVYNQNKTKMKIKSES